MWPSCPALGWASGVDKLNLVPVLADAEAKDQKQNKFVVKPLVTKNPNDPAIQKMGRVIEEHGPYLHGSGFPAVNSDDGDHINTFDPLSPPDLSNALNLTAVLAAEAEGSSAHGLQRGPAFNNKFMSEFGAAVMSSFESMSEFLDEDHWSLDGGGGA